MSLQYLDSVVVTAAADASTVYSGPCDYQVNDYRHGVNRQGLLVDRGDGRCYLPVSIGALTTKPTAGDTLSITLRSGGTQAGAIGTVDTLDDSFSVLHTG